MNSLTNLVSDIYETIQPLCDGNSIDISDDLIDELSDNIRSVFKQWQDVPERNKKFTIRDKAVRKVLDIIEVLLFLVKISGHNVSDCQKEISVKGVSGHMDCKIDGEVVDIKTASGRAFQKFSNGTLPDDDPFGYIAQLSGYEQAEGTNNGGFLAINKETGELAFFQPEELDKINIDDKIDSLTSSLEKHTPPEKCYNPIPEGKAGNMKLPKGCVYCAYKFECHSDTNDGKGLRTFNYAKGPVYLTKVKSEPRVEEILYEL